MNIRKAAQRHKLYLKSLSEADMRNAIAAQCGFKDSKANDWPTIEAQEQYWKDKDIGGNVLPDRIQANEDWQAERDRDLEHESRVDYESTYTEQENQ